MPQPNLPFLAVFRIGIIIGIHWLDNWRIIIKRKPLRFLVISMRYLNQDCWSGF